MREELLSHMAKSMVSGRSEELEPFLSGIHRTYVGRTHNKKLSIVYLKLSFNWASSILCGHLNLPSKYIQNLVPSHYLPSFTLL